MLASRNRPDGAPRPPSGACVCGRRSTGESLMSTGMVTTKDGTQIFYKDWGSGQPVVFSHGWPLNADAWDEQMWYVVSNGFRAVAHDRRSHGRSSQPWDGND